MLSEMLLERVEKKILDNNPKLWQYSEKLTQNLNRASAWNKFITGLYINSLLTHDDFYMLLLATSYAQAQRAEVKLTLFDKTPIPSSWRPMTPTDAGEKVASEKSAGLLTGFWHGHIRMLTPGSLITGVLASEECDSLTVGIEEGWRTQKYKGVRELPYDVMTRATVLRASGIATNVVIIGSETEYSDKGYLSLLNMISANRYFVETPTTEFSENRYRMRAELSNSTTQYLDSGGKTEIHPELLVDF